MDNKRRRERKIRASQLSFKCRYIMMKEVVTVAVLSKLSEKVLPRSGPTTGELS